MSKRLCILDLPGLSRQLLAFIPPATALGQWLKGASVAGLTPPTPAVTCVVQATLTTGQLPSRHGIIANGLATYRSSEDQALVDPDNHAEYRRQVSFWEQSNQLLQAPRFWQDDSGRSKYKTAMLFFQNSMPGFTGTPKPAADVVLTPKPDHGPDGKLARLCWSNPPELVGRLFKELGPFPLMHYWGPMAGLPASQWIARSAQLLWQIEQPALQWTYVPHLDYDLQRFGPDSPEARKAVADVAGALDGLVQTVLNDRGQLLLLSEYAMTTVRRPIQINRHLADAGLLLTRPSPDGAVVDYERSQVFAMVDHQVAHLYTKSPQAAAIARQLLEAPQLATVLDRPAQEKIGLAHPRSGDLVAIAREDAWFDYRWWSSPQQAPGFARQVDIHRKPGYDPLEMFWDPAARSITQDQNRVRGSHGRVQGAQAVLAASALERGEYHATDVADLVRQIME